MKKFFTSALSLLVAATGLVSTYAAVPENGVYEIKHNDRGYLTQNVEAGTIHPGDATLGGFTTANKCVVGRTENGYNPYWYLYTSEKTGSSYIFSAIDGKFLAYDNGTASGDNASLLNLSETPAPFDITEATTSGMYEIHGKGVTDTAFSNSIGWGINVTYRFANIFTDYDGIAHAFVAATVENDEEVINAGIAKILASESDTQATIDSYTEFFNNAKATYADNADIVAIADEALAIIATIDPLVEIPAETIEALEAFKAAIEVQVLIAEKKAALEPLFAAANDPEFYMDILGQFDWCETAEEVEDTYNNLLDNAFMFMQSNLELGSLWKNNRAGRYMGSVVAADGTVSYQLINDLTLNSYWIAEFTSDAGGGIAPMTEGEVVEGGEEDTYESDTMRRTFYLRNVLTNTYVGIQTVNNSVVPVATSKENAAELKLIAGANGFEYLIISGDVENNFLNVANEENAPLVTYQVTGDAGAFWSTKALPSFPEKLAYVTEVKFTGEYTLSEWGWEEWSAIKGVEIRVAKGAKLTEIGAIEIFHYSDDWSSTIVDYSASLASLLEGVTPTAGTYKYDNGYWDENGNYVEQYEYFDQDVYTITLETPFTDYKEYYLSLKTGSFYLTDETNGTTYSGEASAWAEIVAPPAPFDVVVTPVEGTLVELTEINFGCDKNIYANWNCWDAMTLVANGETTLFELYAGNMDAYAYWDFDDPNAPYFKIPVAEAVTAYYNRLIENAGEGEEITVPEFNPAAAGTYVLTVPEGFFTDDPENESNPITVTWTIEEKDGINTITSVTVNGNVIYDLQGRRVANPDKGIYIINGKKTLVK
ncbi:MAG: hypothetical protein E7082_08780 [Bacteroidales bacterium]|nr:hypothetical protein [Bacteroidales bacterium]